MPQRRDIAELEQAIRGVGRALQHPPLTL